MSSIEDKINSILSSPQDMEKIMGLARSLSSSLGTDSGNDDKVPESNSANDSSGLGGLGLDPKTLGLIGRVLGEYNSSSSKSDILNAIKPFLKEDRREKIDKAAKLARIAHIAKLALSEHGGDSDV